MSKRCAKCEKSVYPLEELKCLDKVWHKACFKCWECGMTLNMKNYKGYDKKPYCNAHYPKTSFTAVADTPEMARLAQNTKLQSQVKYHEDFEKNIKGTKTQVDDDPEMRRLKQNTALQSQVQYQGLKEKAAEMEQRRSSVPSGGGVGQPEYHAPPRAPMVLPAAEVEHRPSPYRDRNQGHSTVYTHQGKTEQRQPQRVGSITDYDPMNEQFGSIATGYHPQSTTQGVAEWETVPAPGAHSNHASNPQQPQHYPPAHNQAPPQPQPVQPQVPVAQPPPPAQPVPQPQPPMQPPPPEPTPQGPPEPSSPAVQSTGPVFQAMYDYEAQDEDEVGFIDGDLIVNVEPIDEGWMIGTVRRTGKRGMLPANYVEKAQ